jgi:hypothetical protein
MWVIFFKLLRPNGRSAYNSPRSGFHRLHSSAIRVTEAMASLTLKTEKRSATLMSWSVGYTGTPKEAREALAGQFASAKDSTKNIPHEFDGVGLSEAVINNQLDFLIEHRPDMKVQVTASGSAGVAPEGATWSSYSQTALSVTETA